jgi:hypothetical protein
MEEKNKLSIVLEHWIEHNESHLGEYRKWAEKAGELGFEPVKAGIEEAIEKLLQCNKHLEKARKAL